MTLVSGCVKVNTFTAGISHMQYEIGGSIISTTKLGDYSTRLGKY